MLHRFVSRIENDLAGKAKFVDATEFVDRLKAIKSAEEIALIRKAAAMQDEIFARVLKKIRPGMKHFEVTALAQYEGRLLGSEQGLILGTNAPIGHRSEFVDRYWQGGTLKQGEHFSLLIENNGPGGMYTEIARTVVFGKASNQLIDGFEAMKEAQQATLALMKPGALCRDIAEAHDRFMQKRGLPPELRLYCHGQGYDLVERPLVRADETMTIEKDMNFAVHPGYDDGRRVFGDLRQLPDRRRRAGRVPAQDAEADFRDQLRSPLHRQPNSSPAGLTTQVEFIRLANPNFGTQVKPEFRWSILLLSTVQMDCRVKLGNDAGGKSQGLP